MADQITIRADDSHEYRLLVEVAGHRIEAVLDIGFVHPDCQVGIGLDDESYQLVRPRLQDTLVGQLYLVGRRVHPIPVESGLASVSIVGLDATTVQTRVVNAGENLLGVCYLHQLVDFEVRWDMGGREMSVKRRT